MAGLVRQLEHGLVVQVIVVIMGQDHRFDRWQLLQADRRLVETFGTGPLHRRCAFGEYRIRDPELVVQLQQHRRMPQAVDALVRRRQQLFVGQWLHRNGPGGASVARFVEQHAPENAQRLAQPRTPDRRVITERTLFLQGRFGT